MEFVCLLCIFITGALLCVAPVSQQVAQIPVSRSEITTASSVTDAVSQPTAAAKDQKFSESSTALPRNNETQSSGLHITDTTLDSDFRGKRTAVTGVTEFPTTQPTTLPGANDTVQLGGIAIKHCPVWSCQNRCFRSANTTLLTDNGTNNSTAGPVTPKCACDNSCLSLGDCCVDFFSLCLNITDEADVVDLLKQALGDGTTREFPEDSDPWNTTETIRAYGTCVRTPEGEKYMMVTSCPDGSNPEEVEICENADRYQNLQPYSIESNLALTFRNVRCARCHGYNEDTLIPWLQGVNCSETMATSDSSGTDGNEARAIDVEDIMAAIRSGKCNYIYRPPEGTSTSPRPCVTTGLPADFEGTQDTSINASGSCTFEDLLLCNSYSYETLDSGDEEIKNPHCLKCKTGVTPVAVDLPCSRGGGDKGETNTGSQGGILALFRRDAGSASHSIVVDGKTITWPGFLCADDEVFDDVFLVCRKLFCPPGYHPRKGKCTETEQLIISGESQIFPQGTARLYMEIVLDVHVDCGILKNVVEQTFADLISAFQEGGNFAGVSDMAESFVVVCGQSASEAGGVNSTEDTLKVSFRPGTNLTESIDVLSELFRSIGSQKLSSPTGTITNYESEPPILCPTGYPEFVESANVSATDGELYVHVDNGVFDSLYPLDNTVFKISLSADEPGISSAEYSVILCIQPVLNSTLNCSSVPFDINRTRIVNDTLFVTGTDLSYPPSEYEIHERFVLVCSDFKNLNDLWGNFTFFSFSSAQYYVSMALSLTSVVSLLASLVAFCMISELQTLAGHMTAALAASLAIGQLLLLLDFIRHRLLCSVIAAVCHFCWLAAFSWMSALAMMMARTFNGSLAAGAGNHSPKHQKKVFRKYSAVGWGLPAVMVIALYTVDNVPGVGGVVGYGEPLCGWMKQIYVFLVPVALALVVNIVCFFVTLVSIERTIRATHAAVTSKQSSERQRLLVYAKMSSAMGFTWAFGFAAAFTGESAVWWGYIILNGLQGTFIAFSFVLNARFFRLMKRKVSMRSRKCHCTAAAATCRNDRRSQVYTVERNGHEISMSLDHRESAASNAGSRGGSVCANCGRTKETSFGGNRSSAPSTHSTVAND